MMTALWVVSSAWKQLTHDGASCYQKATTCHPGTKSSAHYTRLVTLTRAYICLIKMSRERKHLSCCRWRWRRVIISSFLSSAEAFTSEDIKVALRKHSSELIVDENAFIVDDLFSPKALNSNQPNWIEHEEQIWKICLQSCFSQKALHSLIAK